MDRFCLLLLAVLFFKCKNAEYDNNSSTAFQKHSVAKCSDLIKINKSEFESGYIVGDTAVSDKNWRKTGNTLKVPNERYVFEDDTTETGYVMYYPLGRLDKKLYIVLQQDYNLNLYYVINPKSGTIYDMPGNPHQYGNYILVIEDEHTDSPVYIELWEIKRKSIAKVKSRSLAECGLFTIMRSYFKDKYSYIEHVGENGNEYFKLKLTD